jgi:hypothetical protein
MIALRWLLAAGVTVSVFAGCGDDDDVDAALPTAENTETTELTGSSIDNGSSDDVAECVFVDTGTVSEAMAQPMELVLSYEEGCEWRATADSAVQTFVTLVPEQEFNVAGAEAVEGIGDEAYVRRGLATRSVLVRIGSDRFLIEAGDLNRPDSYEEAMLAIAESVAGAA